MAPRAYLQTEDWLPSLQVSLPKVSLRVAINGQSSHPDPDPLSRNPTSSTATAFLAGSCRPFQLSGQTGHMDTLDQSPSF